MIEVAMVRPGSVVRGSKNPLHFALPLRLKRAREAKGLTKRNLCALAGVSLGTAFRIENEGRVPGVDIVEKLARVLGVEACILAYGIHGKGPFRQKLPGGAGRVGTLPLGHSVPAPDAPLGCDGLPGRVTAARTTRDLTRKALGAAAQMTGQAVAYIEDGRNAPSIATVEALAVALDVSPCWLAYGVGQGPK